MLGKNRYDFRDGGSLIIGLALWGVTSLLRGSGNTGEKEVGSQV